VGDWVLYRTFNSDQAIIHEVLPRKTVLTRQATGKTGEEQIIAANIDAAFIVQAINNNFNINRLERYLTICYNAGIEPVLIISKTDLVTANDVGISLQALRDRGKEIKFFLLSNTTLEGLDQIKDHIQKGKTYCVIGSSGVGKSTFINNLLRSEVLRTGPISTSTNKGRHVTEHREMFVLEEGGIIIDTPGMKELGITESEAGLKSAFHDIADFELQCRFKDCSHMNEAGCAVIKAVDEGLIDPDSYENYLRLKREQERFQTSVAEKRKKDKVFGKILKKYKKDNPRDKY
jgi:ribosome biogenesis GTPase